MHKFILLFLIPLSLHARDFSFNKETGKAVPNFLGELKLLNGRVMKTTGGRPSPVKIGDKFYPKDSVSTDHESTMKILMTDDTWLSLGPDTELVFSEFAFTDKNDRKVHYELKKGKLSANIRQRVKSGEVKFNSRYASMGVRGTKLMMNYREIKGIGITEYALVEGKAEVTSNTGMSYDLVAGERIVLIEDPKNKETALERIDLSPEELRNYSSPEAEEDKSINNFMPFFELKAVPVTKAENKTPQQENKPKDDSEKEGSFNNLKKLNEQLQDNQKRRR